MATDKALSFVDTTKPEKRFDNKAFRDFVDSLSFKKFLFNPYEGEDSPISIKLDIVNSPMCRGFFDTDCMDNYSYARIYGYNNTCALRVYMKDLDEVIDALTKVRDGFNTARETGIREFPKPLGYDDWAASHNSSYVTECCAACD